MKETIFGQINKIKQATNDYMSRLIDFYGSPENDAPTLNFKTEIPTFTFGSKVDLKGIRKNDEGTTIYVDKEDKEYGYDDFPVEEFLKIAHELSVKQGIGDMFDEMISDE